MNKALIKNLDPCIPSTWKELSVERDFRGCYIEIKIRNPQGVNRGVAKMVLNGQEIKGNLLSAANLKSHNFVEVWLGK